MEVLNYLLHTLIFILLQCYRASILNTEDEVGDFVVLTKLSDEQTKQNNTCLHGPTYNFIQESAMRDQNIDMSDQDEDYKPMPRSSLSFLS